MLNYVCVCGCMYVSSKSKETNRSHEGRVVGICHSLTWVLEINSGHLQKQFMSELLSHLFNPYIFLNRNKGGDFIGYKVPPLKTIMYESPP